MSQTQKIIKNLALALAFFLIVIIFGGIAFVFNLIGNLFFNDNTLLENLKTTNISDKIENLELEIGASNLKIIVSDEFKVETNSKKINIKEKNKILYIEEKPDLITIGEAADIIISIPEDKIINNLNLEAGAGSIKVEKITINNLELELGAGKADIEELIVLKNTDISGGTGQINLLNSQLNNLDIELGMGELNLSGQILGNSQIECGVGNSNITLFGTEKDYKLNISTGIGNIKLNNKSLSTETIYGTGDNKISLSGGIGNISIKTTNERE